MGAVVRRPGPSLRTLPFWCGQGAVCEAWRLGPRLCCIRTSEFCCWVKLPFVISSARAIGRCDTAFRWAGDALFEFARKLLLNAPPCRMLDMCVHVCDLQATNFHSIQNTSPKVINNPPATPTINHHCQNSISEDTR